MKRIDEGRIVGESTSEPTVAENTLMIWRGGTLKDFSMPLEARAAANALGRSLAVDFCLHPPFRCTECTALTSNLPAARSQSLPAAVFRFTRFLSHAKGAAIAARGDKVNATLRRREGAPIRPLCLHNVLWNRESDKAR